MARQRIPGLSYIPVDNLHDEDSFQCVGFNLKVFTVPGAHKYGNCRPVTEFQKLRTIAQGQFGTVLERLLSEQVGTDPSSDKWTDNLRDVPDYTKSSTLYPDLGLPAPVNADKVRDTTNYEVYALKKLRIPNSGPDNPQVLPQNFLRQINNLKVIRHLNIVNLKEVVVGKNLESNYLLLDLCEYSLERVIDQVDAVFLQHRHIKNIMHQMLAGLHFIHRFNVVHRDLCPKNVFFTETGILKIGDFGATRTASDVDMTPNHGLCGYRPPEILFGSTKYTKAVDVWAVGCIFAEMMRQKPLFHGNTEGDIVRSMLNLLGSPSERHWPGFSDLPVPRLYRLKKQPMMCRGLETLHGSIKVKKVNHGLGYCFSLSYNRVRAVFNNQTLATVAYLMKFLQYNPASRPNIEDVMEDRYYEEYPHDCPNEVLIVTLRMSGKL